MGPESIGSVLIRRGRDTRIVCLCVYTEKRLSEDATEEPGGLQSCPWGCRGVGHDLATKQQ